MSTSFYGGRQGFSFVIVKSFPSIAEMAENFKKGPDYSAVHFDEHVLINTENKNDPDNGKVYRRGYDYTNDLGGAVYIGTIVGPAGRAPMLEMTTIEDVKNKQASEGYDYRYSEGEYAPLDNLVPGKVSDTEFNDAIEWACCSIRNENNEDSTAYIGFRFPYTVIEFSANTVSPYYNRSNETGDFINENLVDRTDDKQHPYFEKWNISVPKGIKGDGTRNFRVVPASNIIEDYDGQENDMGGIDSDVNNPRQILVYDYYHYDKDENGEPVSLYLGDYNMIDNVILDEEGTLTINYTHNDKEEYTKAFKWIKQVTLDKTNGHFTVEYNHTTDKDGNPTLYETDLSWINNIYVSEDGFITIEWSTGEKEVLENHIRWISNMEMHPNGTVVVNYNDSTKDTFENKIQWIDSITLEENGDFTVKYNNGTPDYKTTLTWVKDMEINDDGTITIYYNHGNPLVYDKMLKYIDNIYFDKDESRLHVVYNTGDDEPIDDRINYVVETVIDKKDYHYLVYYSDENIRKALIDAGLARTYDGKDGWADLGSIKDDSGVLIGLNILRSEDPALNAISTTLEYLNTKYPDGLTDPKIYGKIVTVGELDEKKKFYAYDYDKYEWYYLGTFEDGVNHLISREDAPNIEVLKSEVTIGGLWFILE